MRIPVCHRDSGSRKLVGCLSAHIAGVTELSMTGTLQPAAENLRGYARGHEPEFLVNHPSAPRLEPARFENSKEYT